MRTLPLLVLLCAGLPTLAAAGPSAPERPTATSEPMTVTFAPLEIGELVRARQRVDVSIRAQMGDGEMERLLVEGVSDCLIDVVSLEPTAEARVFELSYGDCTETATIDTAGDVRTKGGSVRPAHEKFTVDLASDGTYALRTDDPKVPELVGSRLNTFFGHPRIQGHEPFVLSPGDTFDHTSLWAHLLELGDMEGEEGMFAAEYLGTTPCGSVRCGLFDLTFGAAVPDRDIVVELGGWMTVTPEGDLAQVEFGGGDTSEVGGRPKVMEMQMSFSTERGRADDLRSTLRVEPFQPGEVFRYETRMTMDADASDGVDTATIRYEQTCAFETRIVRWTAQRRILTMEYGRCRGNGLMEMDGEPDEIYEEIVPVEGRRYRAVMVPGRPTRFGPGGLGAEARAVLEEDLTLFLSSPRSSTVEPRTERVIPGTKFSFDGTAIPLPTSTSGTVTMQEGSVLGIEPCGDSKCARIALDVLGELAEEDMSADMTLGGELLLNLSDASYERLSFQGPLDGALNEGGDDVSMNGVISLVLTRRE